ncbi:MAG: ASCH domain-containing protein [Clostridia bacterium]|nr:ASCH domain-containing protein [Clostridia bacterium]
MDTIHEMKLNNRPFESIKIGEKIIEMRLYDEKRQLLRPDDLIEFVNRETGEKILTKVVGLHIFADFVTLYQHFDKLALGYTHNEVSDPLDMLEYYSIEEQDKYGVVGIEIEVVKSK